MNRLLKEFAEPGPEFGPIPFWFLNDELTPEEIRRQIILMAEIKLGGVLLHARMGRVTPYLSETWFTCVEAAVDEAEKQGLHIWIYDEDNWPSGYAGGKVLDLGDWTRGQFAVVHLQSAGIGDVKTIPYGEGLIGAWEMGGEQDNPAILERIHPENGKHRVKNIETNNLLSFSLERHRGERIFCPEEKAYGYIDVLNQRVTDAFLESTYELYYKKFGDKFGKTIKGFFMDEPEFHELGLWGDGPPRFPWTSGIERHYLESCGRSLIDDLPSLIFPLEEQQKIRHSYYRLISTLFAENFTRPLQLWCSEHRVKLTGHLILEEHPRMAARSVGNPMHHYSIMDIPGIDHLGKNIELKVFWSSSIILCKQAQSAAHQLDKKGVLCETFAGGTNSFSFTDQKWMGDWMMALGVTLITQHAFHYSLRGYRKRDYPPTFNYQQPYFPFSGELNTHFRRLSSMLSLGKRDVSILLIHPMEGIWASQRDDEFLGNDIISQTFKELAEQLTGSGYDWDLGDEEYMAQWGQVRDGKLHIGHGNYNLVIIPPGGAFRTVTQNLLTDFKEQGGILVSVPPRNPLSIHKKSVTGSTGIEVLKEDILTWIKTSYSSKPQLRVIESDCNAGNPPQRNLCFQKREIPGGKIFFITSEKKETHRFTLQLEASGNLSRLDTLTGKETAFPHIPTADGIIVNLLFEAGISYLFLIREERSNRIILASPDRPVPFKRESPNTLVLDRCRLMINDEPPRKIYTIEAEHLLSNHLDIVKDFQTAFSFPSEVELSSGYLLLETPEKFKIRWNDSAVTSHPIGFHVDSSLKKIPLPGGIRKGENNLVLHAEFNRDSEIDTPFIAGNFAVFFKEGRPILGPEKKRIRMDSVIHEGYPFYAGIINLQLTYNHKGKIPASTEIELEDCHSPLELTINGRKQLLTLPPFKCPLRDILMEGENLIELRLATHLRNFYGPHHVSGEDEIDCFSPADHLKNDRWTEEYLLKPVGIGGEIALTMKEQ